MNNQYTVKSSKIIIKQHILATLAGAASYKQGNALLVARQKKQPRRRISNTTHRCISHQWVPDLGKGLLRCYKLRAWL
jgi:hypothetical protein